MKWTKKGPKWKLAVLSCIDAFEDQVSPEDVRRPLTRPRRRRGMLVLE
ncbi:hypothetical protein NKI47_17940 [Mesorhizobium sp. M0633]